MRNWKTTVAGLAAILSVIGRVLADGTGTFSASDFATVMAGVGLLSAKDYNVTGGTRLQ